MCRVTFAPVRTGKFDEAVAVIREKILFPFVCADACFAPCEDAGAYKQFGDPIAIRALKRVAVDRAGDGWKKSKEKSLATNKKVAIIGAGPTGLTASYYLATRPSSNFDGRVPETWRDDALRDTQYRLPEERLDPEYQRYF